MQKDVVVRIRGLQMVTDEEVEPIEIVVPGQYYLKNGSHYLRYEEILDDSRTPTINYVKMSEKGMEVRKKGLVNVHMVFERNKKNTSFYTTPFGTIQMGIATTGMKMSEEEDLLNMQVEYALDMNEQYVADCYLAIEVQPKDSGEFVL